MATSLADVDSDEWTDPNLTEPKLQDDLQRRLASEEARRRRHQRPKAARYELKPTVIADANADERQPLRIRYFKYIPYRGMSEPDRRKYLNLEAPRLTSSKTEPAPRRQERGGGGRPAAAGRKQPEDEAAFWPSASKAKSLKVYDYHLAELSMTYRSHPSLMDVPRRIVTPTEEDLQRQQRQAARRSLFYQLHTSRTVPASAPTLTQRSLAEKTTQVSRGCTPLFESAVSDNFPTEPGDIVNKSESNRLLNVVSVDECHVRHRRRRRRLRRVNNAPRGAGDAAEEDEAGEQGEEGEEFGEDQEEEEEEEFGGEGGLDEQEAERISEQRPNGAGADSQAAALVPKVVRQPPEQAEPAEAAHPAITEHRESDADAVNGFMQSGTGSTRPSTERRKAKRRSEKEMRQLAAAKFLRRNEILREKMAIYLDWKLSRERVGATDIREGDPATRFERFTVELVRQEALVANQYRGSGGGRQVHAAVEGLAPSSSEFLTSSTTVLSPRVAHGGRPEQLSLTEMFEVLKV